MDSAGDPPKKPSAALGGRFWLEEKLGEDPSGELHRGLDLRSGTATVVRILRGEGAARRERQLRETRRAAQVKHPGLAVVLGVGQTDDGDIYVAAETLVGDRLSDRLAMGDHFDEWEAAEIGTQIAQALAAAHDSDVVHRLLRPSLVVLSYEGDRTHVKVEGLGMPRPPSDSADDPEVAYSAPEQRRGETVGRRADVYSIGAMLYAMLTGEPPTGGGPRVEGILAAVVERCLSEDPKDRFVDTIQLGAALGKTTESLPPRVPSKMPMAGSVPPVAVVIAPIAEAKVAPVADPEPKPEPWPQPDAKAAGTSEPVAEPEPDAPAAGTSVPPAPAAGTSVPPADSAAAVEQAMAAYDAARARTSVIPLSDDGVTGTSASAPGPADPAEPARTSGDAEDPNAGAARAPAAPPPRTPGRPLTTEPPWKEWLAHGPAAQRAGAAALLALLVLVVVLPWGAAVVVSLLAGAAVYAALVRQQRPPAG